MEWLRRIFGGSVSSAEIAKNRLKVVLSYDRTNITPEMLNLLQDEIVNVISQHLDIDRMGMTVSTQRGDNGDHLVADIPIRGLRPFRPSPPPPRPPVPAGVRAPGGSGQKKKSHKRK